MMNNKNIQKMIMIKIIMKNKMSIQKNKNTLIKIKIGTHINLIT